MNRDETLALFAKGKEAWNAWAADMQSQRAALEKSGEWQAFNLGFELEGENEVTRNWLRAAGVEFSTNDIVGQELKNAQFSGWTFPGGARFDGATFSGNARFDEATFSGDARFGGATFSGVARFGGATFSGGARFDGATFSGEAWFDRAAFSGAAGFHRATFSGDARFNRTTFSGDARLEGATFSGYAGFIGATFSDNAGFAGATFSGDARFNVATFSGRAAFTHSTFEGFTTYADANFGESADFSAIRSERAFSLANATFAGVPDFIQAHFAEAPRLDNMHFRRRRDEARSLWDQARTRVKHLFPGDESAPARYRALKRLAIQGHDHESELRFFAGEIASARFVTDHPLIWRIWSAQAWSGLMRFWFGWLYQVTSDFGRSLVRPLVLWLFTAAVAAGYFLGQNPDVIAARDAAIAAGTSGGVMTYASSAFEAWLKPMPCFAGLYDKSLTGLAEPMRRSTNAATEAMHLAFRNALVFVDSGSEAAYRTYGCLYGVERVPIVPSNVSLASALQKVVSGVLIFLFGLAVRNTLRMK
jgi:hypothetical protein